MFFKLHIETDNAAFEDNKAEEVARILRECADRLIETGGLPQYYQNLRDINGNVVGRYAEKEALQ